MDGVRLLLSNLRNTYTLSPNATLCTFQLRQQLAGVRVEIFVYDDIGLLVAFGLGYGFAGEDGDFTDGGRGEHVLEDARTDQACCASEDEMHFVSVIQLVDRAERIGEENWGQRTEDRG